MPREIVIRFCSEFDALLNNGHWEQLFAYTHNGSYTIDNSIVEHFICPLIGERKNSLFFGSGKVVGVLATTIRYYQPTRCEASSHCNI